MAKRKVYSFEERKYSANSIASVILGVLSVVILAAVLGTSFYMKGLAAVWIGAVGFAGIAAACCGLAYGMTSFQDDCKSYFCSKLGTFLSAAAAVIWFFIVCLGIAAG